MTDNSLATGWHEAGHYLAAIEFGFTVERLEVHGSRGCVRLSDPRVWNRHRAEDSQVVSAAGSAMENYARHAGLVPDPLLERFPVTELDDDQIVETIMAIPPDATTPTDRAIFGGFSIGVNSEDEDNIRKISEHFCTTVHERAAMIAYAHARAAAFVAQPRSVAIAGRVAASLTELGELSAKHAQDLVERGSTVYQPESEEEIEHG